MRVLLVTDSLTPTYGWGRYAIGLVRALRRQGVDFTLLSPRRLCTVPGPGRLARPRRGHLVRLRDAPPPPAGGGEHPADPARPGHLRSGALHHRSPTLSRRPGLRPEATGGHPPRHLRRAPLHPLGRAPLVRAGLPAGLPAAPGQHVHPPAPAAALPHGEDLGGAGRGGRGRVRPAGRRRGRGRSGRRGAVPALGRPDQASARATTTRWKPSLASTPGVRTCATASWGASTTGC